MKKAPTQMDAIKKAFASGLYLSGRNALDLVGTMNLIQRVADIRREGWVITSRLEHTKTMFGTPCQYNIYWLNKDLTPKEIYEPFEQEKPRIQVEHIKNQISMTL